MVLGLDGSERSTYGRWHDPGFLVCWASGTKVFLAAAARSLVGSGDLAWDATVADLLQVPAPPSLTVAALVEHRSGLPRILPEQRAVQDDPYSGWTTERFDDRVVPRLAELVAEGDPGQVSYSNLGYAVLARALERSQGRDWIALVRERVVEPLGVPGESVMLAAPGGSDCPGPRTVASRDLRQRPLQDWDVSTGPYSAAGGLCSTVPTMVHLLRTALDRGSALAPGDGPHAWEQQGSRAWHAGALLRSGSLLVVDISTRRAAAAHAVGGLPGHGARHAQRALARLLAAPDDPRPEVRA